MCCFIDFMQHLVYTLATIIKSKRVILIRDERQVFMQIPAQTACLFTGSKSGRTPYTGKSQIKLADAGIKDFDRV